MITSKSQMLIRNASPEDHQKLAYLVHFESYIHRHLDYRSPLEWLGSQPYVILEEKNDLTAALACPADPPQVAWIRLFAVAYQASIEAAWQALWPQARAQLSPAARWVAAIPLHEWFEALLVQNQFQKTHSIVMLSCEAQNIQPVNASPSLSIRPMSLDDLSTVEVIDNSAFVPVWQNSLMCLEYAYRQAAFATVIELDSQLVGYQISTPTHQGGHLARLAILPEFQGRGFATALLADLLSRFSRRGARLITVNTQKENFASLALYKKAGFHFTGEEFPIYQYDLT